MKYLAFIAAIVAVGVACHGDRGYPPGPSALIRDANRNDGNAFFFWLPPLLTQQAPTTQVFSSQLRPVVSITDLCTNSVVRTLSGAELTMEDNQFHANWHTGDDNLNDACTYRIAVTVGTRELGVADVDVVDNGRELKNVDTGEFIPLLDGRTLPIKFFIGVGSQCGNPRADCGEGTVRPDENTTILTLSGHAGVFVPAGAVDNELTISIESSDDRPCIPGLPGSVFPGTPGNAGNSCYDFHTDPPLPQVNEGGKFHTNVTVAICPAADVMALDHPTQDLLQIFQYDAGREFPIRALNNVAAPFLDCDSQFGPSAAAPRTVVGDLAHALASFFGPRPLHASTRGMALDIGTGGSTDEFSRFQWALPSEAFFDFDLTAEALPIAAGTVANTLYSRLGVTFSRDKTIGLCAGTAVYANDQGGQNTITVCPEGIAPDFSELDAGTIIATLTTPAAEACIEATPLGPRVGLIKTGVAFIEAYDANGARLSRTETTTESTAQWICVSAEGITSVRFAGAGASFAIFDNFYFSRIPR